VAPRGPLERPPSGSFPPRDLGAILAALGILALAEAAIRRRRGIERRPSAASARGQVRWAVRLALATAVAGSLLAASCGGGVSFIHRPGTPPETYALTLTATSGSLSSSAPVTLTVTK
jgi:hypothetical protein